MVHDTHNRDRTARTDDEPLPHSLTVEGQGTPASFEITVDGEIKMVGANPSAEGMIVSGATAEGAVETGRHRFRFSGSVTDVTIVNRGGIDPATVVDPEIAIERDASF